MIDGLSSDMAGRAFCVKIQLDVHAVTCPGVWLCPNGKVALQINILDTFVESRRIKPIFPLLFHDRFSFSKTFTRIVSLTELQHTLEQELLYVELIQWAVPVSRGIILATFEINLADLLYPAPCFKGLLAGVDVDLLMEPTKYFPGIIAPKIEISTKTIVEEVLSPCDTSMSKCYVINPKMLNSKQVTCERRKRPTKGIIRQRRVCHTKSKPRSQSCRPYRQRSSNVDDSHQCCSCTTNHNHTGSGIEEYYHSMKKDSICTPRLCLEKSATCDNTHVKDNCSVCSKYNCYFSKCYDDLDAVRYIDSKQRRNDTVHYYRNLSDNTDCCCVCGPHNVSNIREEPTMQLLQSKIKNLQKIKGKLCTTETIADNITECNRSCKFTRDYSNQGFYKNLEKFYKKMYKQAKIRAQEVEN